MPARCCSTASAARWRSTGALTVNGGTFDMSDVFGGVQTVGALSGAGGTIALGANTLTTNSAANTTLASRDHRHRRLLVKDGSGTLTLDRRQHL